MNKNMNNLEETMEIQKELLKDEQIAKKNRLLKREKQNLLLKKSKTLRKIRLTLWSILIFTMVLFATLLCVNIPKDKAKELERKKGEEKLVQAIEEMIKEFYEDYYYPNLLKDKNIKEKKKFLSSYTLTGIPITLNNLAIFIDEDNPDKILNKFYLKIDKNKETCDKDASIIFIYPISPYEILDYNVDINLVYNKQWK